MNPRLKVAGVGARYWGPILVRNFSTGPDRDLVAMCDRDAERAQCVLGCRSGVEVETDQVLMLDHTFCYTPAVTAYGDAVADGVLGEVLYIESVRIPEVLHTSRPTGALAQRVHQQRTEVGGGLNGPPRHASGELVLPCLGWLGTAGRLGG